MRYDASFDASFGEYGTGVDARYPLPQYTTENLGHKRAGCVGGWVDVAPDARETAFVRGKGLKKDQPSRITHQRSHITKRPTMAAARRHCPAPL